MLESYGVILFLNRISVLTREIQRESPHLTPSEESEKMLNLLATRSDLRLFSFQTLQYISVVIGYPIHEICVSTPETKVIPNGKSILATVHSFGVRQFCPV